MTGSARYGDPGLYARSFADVYADWYDDLHDTQAIRQAVDARLNGPSVILELGSGSGHLTTALVGDGHSVVALDSSMAMLQQDHSGSLRLVADMAQAALRSDVADLAIIAWNTLFNLTPVDRQSEAIADVARLLQPGGFLVIDAFVAPPAAVDAGAMGGISARPHPVHDDATLVIATHPNPERSGILNGVHVEVLATGTVTRPWQLAYQSPAEIDAAAKAASLSLIARHADWAGREFQSDGDRHVSWYQAP